MKRSGIIFFFLVGCFLVFVFLLMREDSHRFSWEPTFDAQSKEPFGTFFFDSLMRVTMPEGYESTNAGLKYVADFDTLQRRSVLVLDAYSYLSEEDSETLLRIAERGDKVMCVDVWSDVLSAEFGMTEVGSGSYFSYREVKNDLFRLGEIDTDTLCLPERNGYPAIRLEIYDFMLGQSVIGQEGGSVPYEVLMTDGEYPLAVRFRYGKGAVYLVTPSLLFTNYGVMDSKCRTAVLRMMDELKEYPVVRLDGFSEQYYSGGFSGLAFFARHDSLRFSWQVALVGVLLALIVNARRRQRAIPVRKVRKNATIDFLSQYASLYRKRTEHAPLLQKKYRAFAVELYNRWHIDVSKTQPSDRREEANRLAQYLQRTPYDVMHDLDELDRIRTTGGGIPVEMFRRGMELMLRLCPSAR